MYYVTLKRTVIDFSIYLFVCLSFLIFVFLLTLPSYYNYIHVLNTNTLIIIYIYIHVVVACSAGHCREELQQQRIRAMAKLTEAKLAAVDGVVSPTSPAS